MADLRVAHTADLDAATLEAARQLLDIVFAPEMTDDDWEHALGGMHALMWDRGELVGHAAVVQRRLFHRGRALRTGYVEGVAVRADHRGRGLGAALMKSLERVVRNAYALGALGAADGAMGFYTRLGWTRWLGPTSMLTPTGVKRTADEDGSIYVLPVTASLDINAELTCDWREGDAW